MPFANIRNYDSIAKQLKGKRLAARDETSASPDLIKVDAIFVFNDPRDWVLDIQVITDLLSSHQGYLGSVSSKNGDTSLPNCGYQQDGQPPIYFSNPDLLWASEYHLPRLGQGGFREALEGVWSALTGGQAAGVFLLAHMFGKPHQGTYAFAEKRLQAHHKKITRIVAGSGDHMLKHVYMIGGRSYLYLQSSDVCTNRWHQTTPRVTFWAQIHIGRPSAVIGHRSS